MAGAMVVPYKETTFSFSLLHIMKNSRPIFGFFSRTTKTWRRWCWGQDRNGFQKGDEPGIVLVYDLLVVMNDCFC